jgi:hypothetical protein
MERIVLEGTEEQMENLKALIEHGDNDLPKMREDYQTGNLWCVEDVQGIYDCDEDVAMDVLECALTSESTMSCIWDNIDYYAEEENLKRIEE